MQRVLSKLSVAVGLMVASGAAFAVNLPPTRVPEPGILELVALAAVVGFIARKLRK